MVSVLFDLIVGFCGSSVQFDRVEVRFLGQDLFDVWLEAWVCVEQLLA